MPPRKTWDKESMEAAIRAVKDKKMGFLKAQQTYNVPRGTLFRYLKQINSDENLSIDKVINISLGRKPIFHPDIEKEFVKYCLDMDNRYYGLSSKDLRRLAFQFADANLIENPFNAINRSAGRKWFKNFLRRNPELSLRTAQGTSVARIKGFNKQSVDTFYKLLEKEYEKNNYPAHRVFNCDETGLTIVQSKQPKVLSKKGKKQIGSLTSAERGSLVTIVTCMSASGIYVPPMIIFPRKNMKNELMDGAPAGTIFGVHPSGWIQMDLFTKWFTHFVEYVKPSETDPVLLILDGHYSHVRNLNVVIAARAAHVTILCLPPHCSHKMQPLDVSFMHPLKAYYNEEVRKWLHAHRNPVRCLTQYQISALFGNAYSKAASIETAINGFKKTGIFPFNPNTFQDIDFIQDANQDNDGINVYQNQVEPIAGPSNESVTEVESRTPNVSIETLSPLPTFPEKTNPTRGRKPGVSKIITSTPNKNQLEEAAANKNNVAEHRGVKRKIFPINKSKKKSIKKSVFSSSSDDSETDIMLEDSDSAVSDSTFSESDDDDAECLVCGILWSLSKPLQGEWIQCQICKKWAHDKCINSPKVTFVCEKCKKSK